MTSHPQDHRGWRRPTGTGPDEPGSRPASASLVDPEDDLSSTYGGEFETTAIPRYSSTGTAPGQSVFGPTGEPEPLPYAQPSESAPVNYSPVPNYAAEPAAIQPDDATEDRIKAAGRRGTLDLGLMLIRVGLGALLVVHGLQQAFGWWGGDGLGGLRDSLTESGFRYAEALTYAVAGAQIGAGVLLVLGLFTPLAAAGALAYLINVLLAGISANDGALPFFLPDGYEFEITLIVVAAAIVLTGPGRYGLDAGRGWARRPFVGSFMALLLGIGVGIAIWVLLNGTNPVA
ncbi:DoxX family protein [Mycolicibacterium thermoresistibile]